MPLPNYGGLFTTKNYWRSDVTNDGMVPEECSVPTTREVPPRGSVEEVLRNPRIRLVEVQRLLKAERARERPQR